MKVEQHIEIRPLNALDELAEVEAIQRLVWPDPAVVFSRNQLIPIVRNGGLVLGALDSGRIIGFLISYVGSENLDRDRSAIANLKLVSQRMAMLPDYRDKGIGYELKLAQRQYAIKRGIRLITWTFDPLLS